MADTIEPSGSTTYLNVDDVDIPASDNEQNTTSSAITSDTHVSGDDTHIFRLVTTAVAPIKHLMELLRDLLTEGVFECTEHGIRLFNSTHDNTCIVYMKLKADKFDDFYCKRPIRLPMRMDSLFRVIKLVENGETLTMSVDEADEHVLVVDRFNSSEHFRNSKRIRTIESTEDPDSIPQITYNNIIIMDSTRFQKVCKELSQFGQHVTISSTEDSLSFKTDDDGDNYIPQEIQFIPDDNGLGISYEQHDSDIFTGTFILKQLLQFSKCANLTESVLIHSRNNEFLTIVSDIMDLGHIKICLAPLELE